MKILYCARERERNEWRVISSEIRWNNICAERPPVEPRKRSHALMSKNIVSSSNVHHIMKERKYKINKAIVQNEMVPKNSLDQPMRFGERSAIRVVKKVKDFILGNHTEDVKNLEFVAED